MRIQKYERNNPWKTGYTNNKYILSNCPLPNENLSKIYLVQNSGI